jgi:hypothetical protein
VRAAGQFEFVKPHEGTMVDKDARLKAGELLRHLVSGQITNDQFEERFPGRCDDVALTELQSEAWFLYDDLREYRLAGKDRLSSESRRQIARWVLFLHTDLEYEWPVRSLSTALLLTIGNLCTLGLVGHRWRSGFRRHGDIDVWPFIRRSDYDAALANPPLLAQAV